MRRRSTDAPLGHSRPIVRAVHPYAYLWESLESDATFMMRPMFGTQAAYLDGKLMLCFSKRREPWNGILIATVPAFHEALQHEFPGVVRHPVLAKWLVLPDNAPRFEAVAARLVAAVRRRDPRIGVDPPEKKRRR